MALTRKEKEALRRAFTEDSVADSIEALIVAEGAAVSDVLTADAAGAVYDAAEENLLNEVKAQLNALLASLRAAGIIAT